MEKTALKIKLFGAPVLRKKAKLIKEVTEEHRRILSSMSGLMYSSSGIGLAAVQVGISEAMFVVDIGSGLYKFINPKIVRKEGTQIKEEGCLSVPGVCIKVKRAKKVVLEALDEYAKPVSIEAEDLLACVFQHELDHLNGKLIVDYASVFDKIKMAKQLQVLKEKAECAII